MEDDDIFDPEVQKAIEMNRIKFSNERKFSEIEVGDVFQSMIDDDPNRQGFFIKMRESVCDGYTNKHFGHNLSNTILLSDGDEQYKAAWLFFTLPDEKVKWFGRWRMT